ncbi:hypothetical protein ACFL5V_06955 [Fibrobacterota bacterium]
MKEAIWVPVLVIFVIIPNLQAYVTLEGLVAVAAEDGEFTTISVDLIAEDDEEKRGDLNCYSIDLGSGRGKELLAKVNERVKVTGTVRSDPAGNRHITVIGYEVLSSYGASDGKKDNKAADDTMVVDQVNTPDESEIIELDN